MRCMARADRIVQLSPEPDIHEGRATLVALAMKERSTREERKSGFEKFIRRGRNSSNSRYGIERRSENSMQHRG